MYISNLPRDTTCEDLERIFSSFGKIVHRTVLVDKITNLPRGVGFVRYDRRLASVWCRFLTLCVWDVVQNVNMNY